MSLSKPLLKELIRLTAEENDHQVCVVLMSIVEVIFIESNLEELKIMLCNILNEKKISHGCTVWFISFNIIFEDSTFIEIYYTELDSL